MDCSTEKCLCESMCQLWGRCVLTHELFKGYTLSVLYAIRGAPKDKREEKIVELLQAFCPPKVSGAVISNYFRLRKKGINLDKPKQLRRLNPKVLLNHRKTGSKTTRKNISKVLHNMKPDTTRAKKAVIKNKRKIIAQYLQGNGIDPRLLPKESKQVVYSQAAKIIDRDEITRQALAEPEPNFHY